MGRHDWASVDLFATSDEVRRARFEFWQPDALAWKNINPLYNLGFVSGFNL